jgi:hypothetical protein
MTAYFPCSLCPAGAWDIDMNKKRRETTYIVRIWQEPSELAAPGEWRGVLRSLDGRRQWFFKSAEELWDLLTRGEAPAETKRGKP